MKLTARPTTVNFDQLVAEHQDDVFRLCYRFLSDREDARDAAQEVFVKAYESMHQFDGGARISTWLYRIAVNHCLNVIRSRKRRWWLMPFTAVKNEQLELLTDLQNTPEHEWRRVEQARAVQTALKNLNEQQHSVVILHRFEGLSYREIAEVLNISIASVESRLHRAKKRLALVLADWNE